MDVFIEEEISSKSSKAKLRLELEIEAFRVDDLRIESISFISCNFIVGLSIV